MIGFRFNSFMLKANTISFLVPKLFHAPEWMRPIVLLASSNNGELFLKILNFSSNITRVENSIENLSIPPSVNNMPTLGNGSEEVRNWASEQEVWCSNPLICVHIVRG